MSDLGTNDYSQIVPESDPGPKDCCQIAPGLDLETKIHFRIAPASNPGAQDCFQIATVSDLGVKDCSQVAPESGPGAKDCFQIAPGLDPETKIRFAWISALLAVFMQLPTCTSHTLFATLEAI